MNYALLYRTPREWRISVGTTEEFACGALQHTAASEPFKAAAREFEALLKSDWGVDGPLAWQEIKPDWWAVDLVPGAHQAAGDKPA